MTFARICLLALRYTLFALFVICNAIICCVAIWDLGLAQTAGYNPHIDIFLIFLGTFGLAYIIPILFIDVFVKHAFTCRVWFEGLWVAAFCLMELVGAALLSAQVPQDLCTTFSEELVSRSCVVTRVLQAFTWLCTAILLIYFVTLLVFSICHQQHPVNVWHAVVRDFPWFEAPQSSLNSPRARRAVERKPAGQGQGSPPKRQSGRGSNHLSSSIPGVAAPRPRRLESLRNFVMTWRAGLGSDYKIEPLPTPPRTQFGTQQMQVPDRQQSPSALYPEQVQLALKAIVWDKPEPVVTRQRDSIRPAAPPVGLRRPRESRQISPQTVEEEPELVASTSSPLGDWPRQDIMQRPMRSKKKPPPPSSFPVSGAAGESEGSRGSLESTSRDDHVPLSPRRSVSNERPHGRPSGPRGRPPSLCSVNESNADPAR